MNILNYNQQTPLTQIWVLVGNTSKWISCIFWKLSFQIRETNAKANSGLPPRTTNEIVLWKFGQVVVS